MFLSFSENYYSDLMPTIYIESYGCSASQSEAEIMAGLLEQAGFLVVKNEDIADLVIVVTCYVKSPTQQKILFRLRRLKGKKMIVAGCMPEGAYQSVIETVPKASLVSTHHVKDIAKAVLETLNGERVEYLGKSSEVKLCLPKIRKNSLIDIVPISSGCNSACVYCCVRFTKGKLFSYPAEMITKEIEGSLKQGCREIWLTSQDNASFGLDNDGPKLPELLTMISEIKGNFSVRNGMMNPKNVMPMSDELAKSYESQKIYKFLHLPIQSGDDSVLESMNRNYTVKDFYKILESFSKLRLNFWTDIIVGFPGETNEQFENTLNFVRKARPDWINISKFGLRPGTSIGNLEPVPPNVMNKRCEELSKLSRSVSLERNEEWLGWEGDVLISKKGKKQGQWLGRNPSYKLVMVESKEKLIGKLVKVRIDKASCSHLVGLLK
jgi:threonylcarbamoyladenosine tRNA methylthiotransferase CDKAL1